MVILHNHLLILFVGPKRRSYGTETVVNVPVSVPGPILDDTETGAHLIPSNPLSIKSQIPQIDFNGEKFLLNLATSLFGTDSVERQHYKNAFKCLDHCL